MSEETNKLDTLSTQYNSDDIQNYNLKFADWVNYMQNNNFPVPPTFSKLMENVISFPINQGQLNKLAIRPAIMNEHQESSSSALSIITATNKVIQIFKASKDNINTAFIVAESAATESVVDDIEYAGNNANLQAAWVLTGTNLAVTEATVVSGNKSSTESMRLMMDVLNDQWSFTKGVGSWDMTGATIEFDLNATKESAKSQLNLVISDGVNTSTIPLAVAKINKGIWQHFSVPISLLVGTANITAITNINFQVTIKNGGEFTYIDNLRFRPAPGSFKAELWDMGATLPVSGVTRLSHGTQYTTLGDLGIGGIQVSSITIDLTGGKKLYHLDDFIAGVAKEESANVLLNINNYYALVLAYVDTDVTIYGSSGSSDHYSNGFAATSTASIFSVITAIGANQDIMFGIMSTQEVYVKKIEVRLCDSSCLPTSAGGDADLSFFIEDINENITSFLVNKHILGTGHEEDLTDRPALIVDGGKVEAYYNAGVNDSVVLTTLEIHYYYIPPTTNG